MSNQDKMLLKQVLLSIPYVYAGAYELSEAAKKFLYTGNFDLEKVQNEADHDYFEMARLYLKYYEGLPMATRFLEHFLYGDGSPIQFNTSNLLNDNPKIKAKLLWEIRGSVWIKGISRGTVPIRQHDYSSLDWKNSLGSFVLNWVAEKKFQATNPLGTVTEPANDEGTLMVGKSYPPNALRSKVLDLVYIAGLNEYQWHKDASNRSTVTLHRAGHRLANNTKPTSNTKGEPLSNCPDPMSINPTHRARNFWMIALPFALDLNSFK